MKKILTLALLSSVCFATSAFAQVNQPVPVPPTVNPNQPVVTDHTVNQDERQIGHDQLRDNQMQNQDTRDERKLQHLDANGQGSSAYAQKLQSQVNTNQGRITNNEGQMNSDAAQAKAFEAAHPGQKWHQVNHDDRAEGRQRTRSNEESAQNMRDQKQINYDEQHNIHNGQIAHDERQMNRNDRRMARQDHKINHEKKQAWHDEHHHKNAN